MRGLVWFRKDLRLHDNPALHTASQYCQDGVIGVYIIDTAMWQDHHTAHCQIEFILQSLTQLQNDLAEIHIPLLVIKVRQTFAIASALYEVAERYQLTSLYYNRELEINEARRDQAVSQYFQEHHCRVTPCDDQMILSASDVLTQDGGYFKVFTPFKRKWLSVFREMTVCKVLKKPVAQAKIKVAAVAIPVVLQGIQPSSDLSAWPAGEKAALKRLEKFTKKELFHYDTQRDYPALDNTSKLSPYLAMGMVSAKMCFLAALRENKHELDTGNKGALTWMSELIWREFYRYILVHVPRVCMDKAYKIETERLPWQYNEKLLRAWQQGNTGFPLVDAAMRQLNALGWMHNRLRMVTAMFLSKNLFLDWRLGEQYFMSRLIDGDFASNNGGWQWSASTGTDAVPYFRIFNPITQSQRFDPTGEFIRQYCSELKSFDDKSIHDPHRYKPEMATKVGYTQPIINYAMSRARVIDAFKSL